MQVEGTTPLITFIYYRAIMKLLFYASRGIRIRSTYICDNAISRARVPCPIELFSIPPILQFAIYYILKSSFAAPSPFPPIIPRARSSRQAPLSSGTIKLSGAPCQLRCVHATPPRTSGETSERLSGEGVVRETRGGMINSILRSDLALARGAAVRAGHDDGHDNPIWEPRREDDAVAGLIAGAAR